LQIYRHRITESTIEDAKSLLCIRLDRVSKSRVVGGDSKFHVCPNSSPGIVLLPGLSPVLRYSIDRKTVLLRIAMKFSYKCRI